MTDREIVPRESEMNRTTSQWRQATKLQIEPATEPVTFSDMEDHLRDLDASEQTYVEGLIATARQMAERYTRRAFITQTWLLSLDHIPGGQEPWWDGVREGSIRELYSYARWIELPYPPLQSVTSVIQYNTSDSPDTVATSIYHVDTNSEPGRVVLKIGKTWPSITLRVADGFQITYKAGYGDNASDVPQAIRDAIKRLTGFLYEHRGDCTAEQALKGSGAAMMLDLYRLRGL